MRRWMLILAAPLVAPSLASAQDEAPSCFDVALVARVVDYDPRPLPDLGRDVIVMRWPWDLTLEIEQVLLGSERRERVRAAVSLHTQFNDDVEHLLFFLKRTDGGYVATEFTAGIIEDRRGRFMTPVEAPLDVEEVYPATWIPADYENLLRPVRYRARDAYWLDDIQWQLEDGYPAVEGWSEIRGDSLVALRGIFLDDLADRLGGQPGALCKAS